MASRDGWRAAAEAALKALGEIDILVNNAGVSAAQPMGQMTQEGLDETLSVNVRNLILLTDALSASLIRRKGVVVNISSVSAASGAVGQIAYSTSKGAVNSFTRNASIDLGRSGVRVNVRQGPRPRKDARADGTSRTLGETLGNGAEHR
jgi:NAD(P)-dependent dehydrogenase (short-subunit alcohol dehydrogenase family)